jgi:recombinational DNA repair protein (RecF pathway)
LNEWIDEFATATSFLCTYFTNPRGKVKLIVPSLSTESKNPLSGVLATFLPIITDIFAF